MRVPFKAALIAGAVFSLFSACLSAAYADDPAPVANDDQETWVVSPPFKSFFVYVLDNDSGVGLTVTAAGPAQHGEATIDPGGIMIEYAPDEGFIGEDAFPYTVKDANGQTATAIVTMHIETLPIEAVDDESTYVITSAGVGRYVDVRGNDVAGSDFHVTAVGPAQHGEAIIDDGAFNVIYDPDEGFIGDDTFPYTITDLYGQTATATVTVHVVPLLAVDDQQIIYSVPTANFVKKNSSISVLDNDEGTGLRVQSVSDASHGLAVISDNALYLVYMPTLGFHGLDTFTYTAVDANGYTSTATVTLTVESYMNAVDDSVTTSQNTAVEISVFTNDEGYSNVTIDSVSAPSHGTATQVVCTGATTQQKLCVIYTPVSGFTGEDTFTYTLKDDTGNQAVATVAITVTPIQVTSGGSTLPPSSAPMALVAVGMIIVASAFALLMTHR